MVAMTTFFHLIHVINVVPLHPWGIHKETSNKILKKMAKHARKMIFPFVLSSYIQELKIGEQNIILHGI